MTSLFDLATYDYSFPQELIAHQSIEPRDLSRLLIVDRAKQTIEEAAFLDLPSYLRKGDLLIRNNSRVIPARLHGKRASGGEVEIFLVEELSSHRWKVLLRPAKKIQEGELLLFPDEGSLLVEEKGPDGTAKVCFQLQSSFSSFLHRRGKPPLPPYLPTKNSETIPLTDYQTCYHEKEGSLAAPTAGFHFTSNLLQTLSLAGVEIGDITLHIGLSTFRPIRNEDIRDHPIHHERFSIDASNAMKIQQSFVEHRRRIMVGTSSLRAVESLFLRGLPLQEGEYSTDLFIYPGFSFRATDILLTNFHQPKTTLLALVFAFGGIDLMKRAYAYALEKKFRLFSFGDAMLIL